MTALLAALLMSAVPPAVAPPLAFAPHATQQQQQQEPQFPRGWTVQDLLRPVEEVGPAGFFWEHVFALGDVERDGLPELGFLGRTWDPGIILERRLRLTSSFHLDTARDFVYPNLPVSVSLGGATGPQCVLLAMPGGVQLVAASLAQQGVLEFRDVQTLAKLGSAQGPGLPRALLPAGDLDADGWDDFFALGAPLHLAAYSGRTHLRLWEQVLPAPHTVAWASPYTSGAPPDLDGDGAADLVVAARVSLRPAAYEWTVFALSGADGSRIWRAQGVSVGADPLLLAQGPDWTGDGVSDCALVASDTLAGIDGADGTVLWQHHRDVLAPLVRAPLLDWYLYGRPVLTRWASDPTQVDLVLPLWELESVTPWESQVALLHVDAATGLPLSRDDLPADLWPFDVHPLTVNGSQPAVMPLGDVDRDGLVEVALEVGFPNETTGGFGQPPGGETGIALLGLRTLSAPRQVSLARTPTVHVALPGAAGRTAYLAAGVDFDRYGGLRFGAWRSYLFDDGLFAFTFGHPAAIVPLDARGRGTTLLQLPQQPALAGRTVTLRALVPQASGSDLWTQSTLHQMVLVP